MISLGQLRAGRLAQLASTYPPVHWAILALLSGSILVGFVIEADQGDLLFLDALQLRLCHQWAFIRGEYYSWL